MDIADLAKSICTFRNSDQVSRVIFDEANRNPADQPVGVLLFKPSSGHISRRSIGEILERLVVRHRYAVRAGAWWNGADLRVQGMMARHYPGFHRVARGGLTALSPTAHRQLAVAYASSEYQRAFGTPFDSRQVHTPYGFAGISPERLNEVWELDRSKDTASVRTIQRLDEDAFVLALGAAELGGASQAGEPIVLLNGFYAKLEADFEAKGCVALWIQRERGSTTSWEALRSQFAGKTNPFQAPPNTVRGDAARGVLEVERVSILANVIHLSADELQGEREVHEVWWDRDRFQKVFGG
jgi:hypothetical protein